MPSSVHCWNSALVLPNHEDPTDPVVGGEPNIIREQYSTVDLIDWLRDRDGADQDNASAANKSPSRVGERLKALERYAKTAGHSQLVTIINRVRRNNWPPKPKAPRVLRIVGVKEFARPPYGRGPKDKFLVVETKIGPGIMSIPGEERRSAFYWIGADRYHQLSWKCLLRKELVQQIEALLHPKSKEIGISFLTMVFLVKALSLKFPGGLSGFDKKYQGARMTDDLRGLAVMSGDELDQFMEQLKSMGITAGVDYAVGELMLGEVVPCQGVRFVGSGDFPKSWVAVIDPF